MKYLLTLLLMGTMLFANAQVIPNASFENWTPYNLGEYPTGWTTSDSIAVSYGGGNSVFKGTDAHDGAFSMHLKSVQITFIITIKGPGVATNGIILNNNFNFTFDKGVPDTSRSRVFSFWYKYDNSFNTADAGIVKVAKLRNTSGTRDTIAVGFAEINPAASYTMFSLPLVYKDFQNQPDTSIIIFQSSRALNDPTCGVGNVLVVDSVSFGGFVGINEVNSVINGVRIYPQPATDRMTIEVELNTATKLAYQLFDITGRQLVSKDLNNLTDALDVSSFPAGRYILKLSDQEGHLLYSTSISIGK